MNKLLLINVSANSGSTGRIAEEIGQTAIAKGYECYFGYGRIGRESKSHLIRIGSDCDVKMHGLESMLFDNHGFGSRNATKRFIQEIERINPDVINLHNIHGYYLNVEILFEYLAKTEIPVVWTLHDCWPFTGHCAHFERFHCEKWKTGCYSCPNSKGYPKSLFFDRSRENYARKKALFTKPKNITFVAVCNWMANNVRASFLGGYPVETIYNGVNLDVFRPIFHYDNRQASWDYKNTLGIKPGTKVVLGVGSVWDKRKGLDDFVRLRGMMNEEYAFVLVGLSEKQIKALPQGIIGIRRTESVEQLAELYSLADVFVNPTYVDNFPTVNIEALACGTPVITYRTGGSPEAVDENTGFVVEQGNLLHLNEAIVTIASNKYMFTEACRKRAENNYNMYDRFADYVDLFDRLTK